MDFGMGLRWRYRAIDVPLLEDEQIVVDGLGSVGSRINGRLVVTDQRLLFQPWGKRCEAQLLSWGCTAIPETEPVIYAVAKGGDTVNEATQGLADIVGVEPCGDASFSDLPRVRIIKSDGSKPEFGVAVAAASPKWSKANNTARDDVLFGIRRTFLSPPEKPSRVKPSAVDPAAADPAAEATVSVTRAPAEPARAEHAPAGAASAGPVQA